MKPVARNATAEMMPPLRACFICAAPIQECMGFCLARDVIEVLENRSPALGYIRELCWRCVETCDPAEIHP